MSASRFPRFITSQGWLAILYSLGVFLSIFALFSHWTYDDPFITYRYAEKLAQGLGFVYNPGERVLSTTTPLFTLLLATLHGLWPDLHPVANLIGAFGLALGALCLWDLARIWQAPWVGYTFLLLYPTFGLLLATLGSETSLYIAFCYRAAGEWLRANTPPEAKVGTLEVGIIGYYARRPKIDFAGLIQPEVAKQLRLTSTYEDSARWAIRVYQPEYLVLGPTWFPNLMNDSLLLACSTQKTFPGGEYGYSGEIIVYQCAWPK